MNYKFSVNIRNSDRVTRCEISTTAATLMPFCNTRTIKCCISLSKEIRFFFMHSNVYIRCIFRRVYIRCVLQYHFQQFGSRRRGKYAQRFLPCLTSGHYDFVIYNVSSSFWMTDSTWALPLRCKYLVVGIYS